MSNNTIPSEWWNQILSWLWVIALSIWGGTVHTIRKIKDKEMNRFSLSEWVGDVVISGFMGVITYALCHSAGFDDFLTAAMVGVSSHQGTRGLLVLEKIVAKKFGLKD